MHSVTAGEAFRAQVLAMESFRYDLDEAKRAANLAKHGVGFVALRRFDWAWVIILPDRRRAYGEERLLAYGMIDGRLHAVVYPERGPIRRMISIRRANCRERAAHQARARGR